MAKKDLTPKELIISHLPKKVDKYKVIIKDADLDEALKNDPEFDQSILDTINDDGLIDTGYNRTFNSYDRSTVSKAKEPTVIDENKGIVVSKQLITKTDKKLLSVDVNTFPYNDNSYVMIKFVYEKFDIVEVFLLVN